MDSQSAPTSSSETENKTASEEKAPANTESATATSVEPSPAPAAAPAPEERTKEIEEVTKVVDQFDNLTIFGNKSLNELHKIQSKKSHLSAGIDFTDPSLKM